MDRIIRLLLLTALWAAPYGAAAQSPAPVSTNIISVPAGASLPQWPKLAPFTPESGSPRLVSKDLELVYAKTALGGFLIRASAHPVAVGGVSSIIGYVTNGQMRWLDCSQAPVRKQSVKAEHGEILASYECVDPDEATWVVTYRFRPETGAGAIDVQTEVSINQDRSIAFLPILMIFPGAGSFGTGKGQGLFAGLEYLENEPSSSEADVIGPASKRQVPDGLKVTFPLMAVQADNRYVALSWQMRPYLSALFDSPDRLFNSGAHVMGVLFPGSNGKNREEGKLLPRATELVRGGHTIVLRATIIGGLGESVVPAIQQFCQLRRLPPVPAAPDLSDYVSQAAAGWLDSKIREGNLVRHALANAGFNPQPAADAALWMEWLADHDSQAPQAARLRQTATNLLTAIPPESLNYAGVGHVRYPVEALVFGHVAENAEHAAQAGKALLPNFQPDGSVKYRANPGGPDFAKTHFSDEASGFTSRAVADLLEAAAFSGERALLDAGLRNLRAMDKFHNGVPRGAQTWECPLHTPDILASAHMVRAYTLGYELSGDTHFLEEARYWAWTGVPFVYLVNPTENPIGLYSTIAVFGATQWRAPVWFGLPVQWCGLVYADALYRLAREDPRGIWKQVADGIAISGMQQSWPEQDAQFQGLLPDSFALREQKRNGPAINPATVEACASRYFGAFPAYDFKCFRTAGLLVHAPGEIIDAKESKNRISFQVQSWVGRPYFVLMNGFTREPRVTINGATVQCAAPHQFIASQGRLILQVQGRSSVALDF